MVLIYSVALCCISFLAKKTMLEDLSKTVDAPVYLADILSETADPIADNPGDDANALIKSLEALESKADISHYPIFDMAITDVSITTSVPPTEEAAISAATSKDTKTKAPETTAPPETKQTSESTKKTTEKTTKETTTEPEKTTEPKTAEPEITDPEPEIEENDDPDIDIDEDDVVSDIFDENYIKNVLDDYYNNLPSAYAPGSYPGDKLRNGKSYHDDIITYYDKTSGRYVTDNAFDIVCKITYNEIGSDKHPEAIKAQAVAVYSYIKHYEQRGEYASLSSKKNPPQVIIDAVEAVDGLAMLYGDEYVMAAFSAASAGVTCSSENVWGGARPYLQSVVSEYDYLDESNFGRVTTYTADELKKKIQSKTNITLSNDYANWISILSYHDGRYVDKIALDGHTTAKVSGKERELTAYVLRSYILDIRSTCFTVSYSNGVFTFVTYGYGHGVGMSQKGAHLYATYGGYTFDQILHHYYTDITIR